MARLVVGAVGAVVGFYLGGPAGALEGFSLAYGATGFLDPHQKQLGPKLNDLKAPTASYGTPIAYLEGAPRLAGNYIWGSAKREIATTTTTGKGGPGVDSTTFTYEMDVLIELAINRCQAVRRAWSNGKLIWSQGDGADADTIAASANTNTWRDLRFYDGNPTQLPDPTYEAAFGVGNVPAYRGRTTIMIEGLNLGNSGQLPVLTFEVVSEAGTVAVVSALMTQPTLSPFSFGTPAYSLSAPFDLFVPGDDISVFGGYLFSFDVYTVDPAGSSTFAGHIDIGQHGYVTMQGNSDESLFIAAQPSSPVAAYDVYTSTGASVSIDTSAIGWEQLRFSKLLDDMVVAAVTTSGVGNGSNGFNDLKLRRYQRSTGALMATAAVALPLQVQSVAIGGAYVYALSTDGTTLYQSDLSTLALVSTIAIPSAWNAVDGFVMCDGSVPVVMGAGSTAWVTPLIKWNGATWDVLGYSADVSGGAAHAPAPSPSLATLYSNGHSYGQLNYRGGVLFGQAGSSGPTRLSISYLASAVSIVAPTLDQVVRRLCLRTLLLTDADIDVTDLSHDVAIADGLVRSMAISQVSTTRNAIETLMAAYLFEAVEGPTLRFVRRGGASALTIPFADLGAGEEGKAEPLPLKRSNDMETAARISVKFSNVLNDAQDGLEAGDRLVTNSEAEEVVELPLGFQPVEAKKLADARTLDTAVGLTQIGPMMLTRKYAALEPTDVVTVVDEFGDSFRVRVMKQTIGSGVLTLELVLDDATIVNSAAVTDGDYASSTLIRLLSNTVLRMLDIPILRDADNAPGVYAAFGATGPWSGAELDRSPDDTTYTKILDVTDRAVMGSATTTLGNYSGVGFDEVNAVTVDVGEGTLASATRDALLTTTANAMLVGSEVIQFRDATLVSPGVYTLTGLLRGRRGTEWAMGSHTSPEDVTLLQTLTGLRRVGDNISDLGVPYDWKAVTHGKSRATAGTQVFTDTGVGLKPFAPVDLVVADEGSALVLSWHRRSRLSGSLLSTVAPPLGEASESYEVDVFDGVTLVRTATCSTPEFRYTFAMQSADGVDSGSSLTFKVYQMSATVGRGYPGTLAASGNRAPLPQVSTVTLSGSYASGAAMYVVLGSTRFDYTSTGPDATLSGIATSLAAVIDADATHAAVAVGAVITITGPASVSEPITAALNAGDDTIAFATTQTASPIVAGRREEFNYTALFNDSGAINPITTATLLVTRLSDGMNRSYTGTPGTSNPAFAVPAMLDSFHSSFVASGDRAAFDLDDARIDDVTSRIYTPLADPLNWTVGLYSTDPNLLLGTARRGVGVVAVPVARPQVSTATLAGTPIVGAVYRVTLGGVDYDYTALIGDTTMTLVAAGLAPVIDAAAAYVAGNVGPVITVTGAVANVPFTFAGTVLPSTVRLTAAITQAAA